MLDLGGIDDQLDRGTGLHLHLQAVLESGSPAHPMPRLDVSILKAVVEAAHAAKLPVICHTGNSKDVADALDAGVDGIEHGSNRDVISEALFARMKQAGTTYDPTLSVMEALADTGAGKTDLLDLSLVQQVGPRKLLDATKKALVSPQFESMREAFRGLHTGLDFGKQNLAAAYRVIKPCARPSRRRAGRRGGFDPRRNW